MASSALECSYASSDSVASRTTRAMAAMAARSSGSVTSAGFHAAVAAAPT